LINISSSGIIPFFTKKAKSLEGELKSKGEEKQGYIETRVWGLGFVVKKHV